MIRKPRLTMLALLAWTSVLALPAHALKPFSAEYAASYKGISAGGSMTLTRQGNRWTYAMGIRNAAANLSQATVFEDAAGRYRPVGGSDRSTYLMKTRSIITHYNWKALQARWSGDVKPHRAGPIPLRPGDMDALLVNLALVRDVGAGRNAVSYRLVENGRAKPLSYRVVGREKLVVAGRTLDTSRAVQVAGDKQTTVWVAAGVPTPVRIVQREGGSETFRLQLTSWR
ncbi:DUF3108 domain-containing protein [Pseudoxanthomonas sp. SL93]|uniref:DUF3108 domain-containing protein n=1 Tax=Pseudoxanthomonas sp. SL93 TaxID=2995142 RepID=UPI002270F0E3|nr:DUF3108 domain-containing protein [Pseudoxanthomonas sp. SL93]WAC63204.1 DUF3108 domain-containing protein [Pseudoxanthomonas sp. SL93]